MTQRTYHLGDKPPATGGIRTGEDLSALLSETAKMPCFEVLLTEVLEHNRNRTVHAIRILTNCTHENARQTFDDVLDGNENTIIKTMTRATADEAREAFIEAGATAKVRDITEDTSPGRESVSPERYDAISTTAADHQATLPVKRSGTGLDDSEHG
jgi:hypothetical protein